MKYHIVWDRFLSPVPDRRGSYERGSRSTLVIGWNFFSSNVLSIFVPGHKDMLYYIIKLCFGSKKAVPLMFNKYNCKISYF